MRSAIKKWGLIALAISVVVSVSVVAAFVVYRARPAQEVVVVMPAVPPTATPLPYFPATAPDLSLPPAYSKPLKIPLGPHASTTLQLHIGPSEDYVVLGILPAGARLEVVGRDESSEWLAVVFPPNSTFRAWLPVSQAGGLIEVEKLPIEPVRLLP